MPAHEVLEARLENGLTVLLRESHAAPVASFFVWYRVGSRNEIPGITGVSHWIEHMLFKGTPTFPKGEISKAIQRLGGLWNAFTWQDYTAYYETVPAENLDLPLRLEADRMVNALFDPAEVEAERTVIISERQMYENRPWYLLQEAVQAAIYRIHPYRHPVIGEMCDLQNMTRADLYTYYRRHYAPNNAVAVAVGDFSGPAVLERIHRLYGQIPAGAQPEPVRAKEPPQLGERRITVKGPGATNYLLMAYHSPPVDSQDFMPMMVLSTILGGAAPMGMGGGSSANRTSRLYKALVETQMASGVTTGQRASRDPAIFSVYCTAQGDHPLAELEAVVLKQTERMRQEPITSAELERAIKQTRAQFAYSHESVSSQSYWLGFAEVVSTYHFFLTYADRLAEVTPEAVLRVAQTYLAPDLRTTGHYLAQNEKPLNGGKIS
ncbi:MAG: insulinase family protein [Chloroflexi bacterium]|nr:insulinase family protein [Chloroflexota bacterium]